MSPPITLQCPLPASALRFDAMSHTAGLSLLEETRLSLLSELPDIAAEDLLGQGMSAQIALSDGSLRHIHGLVTRFGIGRSQGRYFGYEATVRPWLWFLTRTTDCRIFQHQTVQQIVEAVFADHAGIAKFEFRLSGAYRNRDYTVQYRESDYNFIARLLEDEGIYWYFEHSAGQHQLVLVHSVTAHPPMSSAAGGHDSLPFYGNAGQVPPDTEYVSQWNFSRGVETGRTALTSYDFERPSTSLLADRSLARAHSLAGYEQFDYLGDYTQRGDGAHLADVRLDEQQSRHEQIKGNSNAHGLAVGHRFKLKRHPREDQNTEYLCVSTVSVRPTHLESPGPSGKDRVHVGIGGHDDKREREETAAVRVAVQGDGAGAMRRAGHVGRAGGDVARHQRQRRASMAAIGSTALARTTGED